MCLTQDAIFGSIQRTKRIEVVQSQKKKAKTEVHINKSNPFAPSLLSIGLGTTKASSNNKTLKIEPISFNKLITGCLVSGFVLQMDRDRVVISLPGGSTGMVAHHEISDVVYKMKTKMNKTSNHEQVVRFVLQFLLYLN